MTIEEMHTAFRTLGQQKGLQLVRAILPDSIDVYLNDMIIEWTRKTIQANVETVYKDKVTLQNNSINPINGVRTLYKRSRLHNFNHIDDEYYTVNLAEVDSVMYYTSFELKFPNQKRNTWCRFVDRDKLMNTLSDYCNGASKEYPIVCMHFGDSGEDVAELYLGDTTAIPTELIINYVGLPVKVKLDENNSENNIDCNLPEFCHYEIVEGAVNKFFASVGSTNRTVSNQ